MRENPRANGLARRAGSCAHPIPYACMSAPVRFMVGVWMDGESSSVIHVELADGEDTDVDFVGREA